MRVVERGGGSFDILRMQRCGDGVPVNGGGAAAATAVAVVVACYPPPPPPPSRYYASSGMTLTATAPQPASVG